MICGTSMLNRIQQDIRRVMRSKKDHDKIVVSFIVVVYDMPLQARTLSGRYFLIINAVLALLTMRS